MKTLNEPRLMTLSALGSLVFGGLGIAVAAFSGSVAVFADGFYSFASAAASLLALPILRLVKRGGDRRFQFGYAAFEPLYVLLSTLVIIAAQYPMAVEAFRTFFGGGSAANLRGVVLYQAFSAITCFAVAFFIHRRSRFGSYPILHAEARSWLVDGLLSAGVLLSFVLVLFLERGLLAGFAPYADPVVTLILLALLVPILFRNVFGALGELLSAAPTKDLQEMVMSVLAPFEGEEGIAAVDVAMEQRGRYLNLRILLFLGQDLTLQRLLDLQSKMDGAIRHRWPEGRTDFSIVLRKLPQENPDPGLGRLPTSA